MTKEYQASNSKDALLWLNERGRLRVLQAQIEVELRQFADKANQETRAAQEEVIREAQLRAEEGVAALAMKAGVDLFWNKIDPRVLTQMVGVLQKGRVDQADALEQGAQGDDREDRQDDIEDLDEQGHGGLR